MSTNIGTLPQSHLRDLADGTHVVASTDAGRRTGLIGIHSAVTQMESTTSPLTTPNIFVQTSSEFRDRQDFEHSKSIVFACWGECALGLDSRQRGKIFEPVLWC